MWESGNFKEVIERSGRAYSDGSGGPKEVPKEVTQVSFGAVAFDFCILDQLSFEIANLAVIGGQVPGRQTVPRAELWGGIQTLLRTPSYASLDLGIDAKYVTQGVKSRGKLCSGDNGDLWSITYNIIDSRAGPTNIFKVSSHLEDQGASCIIQDKINFLDLAGNALADAVAEKVAVMIKPDSNCCMSANYANILGFLVAKRLVLIQADIRQTQDTSARIYALEEIPGQY